MFIFNLRFFFLTVLLFIIEVLIALFVHDRFVRPYVGDYLVVILIYCAGRTFFKLSPVKLGIGVFLFACLIETLQYFNIVDRLGLTKNVIARTVIGYGFEWYDILAYFLGVITVLVFENQRLSGARHD
ncbi:MAG: DUF2809 domain-containing protein [Flavisolibacter sp.]